MKINEMKKDKKKNSLEAGFTLLELLVVISIIGLLATIILVNLTSARKRARDIKRVADIRGVSTALEDYYGKNGQYPGNIDALVTSGLLPVMPRDPLALSTCGAVISDVCQYYYAVYTPTGAVGPQSYHLGASLEDAGSALLNQDRDCNSTIAASNNCPYAAIYNTGGLAPSAAFSGAQDTTSCSGSAARAGCYDVAQ